MKKIVISNFDDISNPYYGGGGAIAVHEIAKKFASEYDVTVITGKYPGAQNTKLDGVRYKRIGIAKLDPRVGQLIYQLILWFYVLTTQFDLWIESFTPPFSTSFLPLFTHKPIVGWVHMLASEDMQRKYKLPIFRIIESFGLRRYKNIAVVTDTLKHKIRQVNPECKITYIPNGIDSEFRRLVDENTEMADKKKHILYLGRLEVNQKGLDLLLQALNRLEPGTKLVIAGAGAKYDEESLRLLIKKHHLEESVKLVGRVSGLLKVQLLREAYCVIIPSRFETFGIVAVEAMYCGIPVITFDIEGFNWIPPKTSIKVSPFNVNELASNISLLLDDPTQREGLSKRGREVSSRYTWETSFYKFEEVIRSLV